MRQILRLLRFGLPYWLHWIPGVLLLAAVGLLEALRMAFFVPILGVVLRPSNPSSALPLFPFAPPQWQFDIHRFVPFWMHNAWTVVAVALVGSTIIKGLCDYAGTYLVNYAGFPFCAALKISRNTLPTMISSPG